MTERRRLAVGVGLAATAGGLLLLAVPALGGAAVPSLLAIALTLAVGVVALWFAASALFGTEAATVSLPTPESRPTCRRPGDAFAAMLADVTRSGRRQLDDPDDTGRERLSRALEALAVAVLARTDGWDADTAGDRLADGTWTDDADAAAFFADSLTPPLPRRALLPGADPDLPVARRGRHVVAALAERIGESRPDPDAVAAAAEPSSGPYWPTAALPTRRSTGLTTGVSAAVLAVSAIGVGFGRPGLVLVAVLGIALVATARVWSPSADVELSRDLSTDSPAPGERVTVTVTVRNAGDRTLSDIRLLDGVPAGLCVVDGSPRFATALRPGKATTVSYTVEAVDGDHTFEPGLAVISDPVGATELLTAVDAADGPTTLACGFDHSTTGAEAPRPQVTVEAGRREGDASGSGVEFDAIREYRPGDPPARIDWNRRAKTGALSTVEFREPRRPNVVVLVDSRPAAYVADSDGIPAPRHGARAAHALASQLLAAGVPVGVGTVPASRGWVSPGAGATQRHDITSLLAGDDAVPWTPPTATVEVSDCVAALTARLDPDTQVVFLSPCADDDSVAIARRLDIEGHRVTVLSPDCTDGATVTGAYGRLDRWRRLGQLRGSELSVRDWCPDDDIEEVALRVRQ